MNKKLLRKKLALMLATLKKKRKYYCEVEYLENTGTLSSRNWISTGIVPDTTTKWEVRLSFNNTTTGKLMGSGYATPTRFNIGIESNRFRFAFNGWFDANSDIITPDTNIHTWIMDAPSKTFTIDGYSVTTTQTFGTSTFPIALFGRCNSGNGNTETSNAVVGKIYYSKIWQDNVLVRDLIPVLDWDMTPCMYDKVSGQFFYNKGTGSFSYGREIHYVDYLEADGTQYINTNFKPTTLTDFEIEFSSTKTGVNNWIMGCATWVGVHYKQLEDKVGVTNNSSANAQQYISYTPNNSKMTLKLSGNTVYANGVSLGTITRYAASQNLALFGYQTNATTTQLRFTGSIYKVKIWDNNVPIYDFKPAIDENGVGFMFDKITHTIFDNAGQGQFKYSAREVEYLQSDGARAIVAGVTVDDTCGYDVKWMALNANDTIILGTKGTGDSRWVLSGSNDPNVNLSWNTSSGGVGLGLNKIQTAQMNYLNDRKRILNGTPLTDISTTLSANASAYNVGIFGGYWGYGTISLYSTCRIYYAKITKGTEFIRDFIPMIKDGSPCLFDKVGGLYYFGTGTGTFLTGKVVEPEYES